MNYIVRHYDITGRCVFLPGVEAAGQIEQQVNK